MGSVENILIRILLSSGINRLVIEVRSLADVLERAIHFALVLEVRKPRRLTAARGPIREQLAAVLQQALDVGLDRSQAGSLLLLVLPGSLTQGLQMPVQQLEALLQADETLGEGVNGFGQILGMAADPERHRGAGHHREQRVAA